MKPKLSKNKNINVNKEEYLKNNFLEKAKLKYKKFKKDTKKISSVKNNNMFTFKYKKFEFIHSCNDP